MALRPIVLTAADHLATGGSAERFCGSEFGADVSFFVNHSRAGHVTASHRHPYAEVFVILGGDAEFTVAGAAHAADGRLSVEELESRLERAHGAVYDDELRAVEVDLPSAARPARRDPWPAPPFVALLLLGAIAAVALTAVVGHPFFPPLVAAFVLWRFAAFR